MHALMVALAIASVYATPAAAVLPAQARSEGAAAQRSNNSA
ncbi:MAG TPA: hypothetical protein VGQ62_10875 [Chloroflexota bacterium]|nr:hypothetical protein [Chloroflexota bacterium]